MTGPADDASVALRTGPVAADPISGPIDAPATTLETSALLAPAPSARRRLGLSELRVFPLALNGNVFGWTAGAQESERVLDAYVGYGGNFVDTADSYASGRSEIIIGNWLRSRRNRDEIVVGTKVGKGPEHPGLSPRAIEDAVHASLRRLRTDRIDLLSLHVDDPDVEFEETLLAVDELIRAGKVRYFGAAHHTGDRLIQARIACAQLGVAPMVSLQNQYHLMFRQEYERGLAQVATDLRLGVLPKFGLASGFLAGRYRAKSDLDRSQRRQQIARYFTRTGMRVLTTLDAVAEQHDAAPATIALAWLLAKPNVVAPVVSASTAEQVIDLVAAAEVQLTRSQVAALDRASA